MSTPTTKSAKPAKATKAAKPTKARKSRKQRKGEAAVDDHLTLFTASGDAVHAAPGTVIESLRYMLARARLNDGGELPDRLGLTSTLSGEGVTSLCRSLALVLTNDASRRVCMVDLNWWDPAPWTGDEELIARGGMAAIVRGSLTLDDALIPTGNVGLEYLPAGASTMAERPLLANSPELGKTLIQLSERFDHVLLDLPAVHATSDSLVLAEASRTVVLVVAQGATPEPQVKAAVEELNGVHLLGVILNRASSKVPKSILRRLPGA